MSRRREVRICHGGMEEAEVRRFEQFLRHVTGFECLLAEEPEAEVAVIDTDGDLGSYLVRAHRMLYPARPIIHVSAQGSLGRDALSVWARKPVDPAAFGEALARALAAATPAGSSDSLVRGRQRRPSALARDRNAERIANLYVGSMTDIDVRDAAQRERASYHPGNYLQGFFESARQFAGENGTVTALMHRQERILTLSADGLRVTTSLDRRSLRSLGLIPLAKQDFRIVSGTPDPDHVWQPASPLLWELALWASRGRIPAGVPFDVPVHLLRWPNLTRLGLTPDAIRIAALWSGHPTSLVLSARTLQLPQRNVFAFFSACRALGLVRLKAATEQAPEVPPTAPAPGSAGRGLFNRILAKLPGLHDGTEHR
ncbi:MAG: hypothetical protein KDG52_07890 [Rhodocyclaceae bacterium]|nr:hypothetical protein [Rhodocyclaceae bacterium]